MEIAAMDVVSSNSSTDGPPTHQPTTAARREWEPGAPGTMNAASLRTTPATSRLPRSWPQLLRPLVFLCFTSASRRAAARSYHSSTSQPSITDGQIRPKSSESVRSVRIRSTTSVHLLHEFVLLPSGISGKMIISLDTITIIAMLVVSFLSRSRYLPLVV